MRKQKGRRDWNRDALWIEVVDVLEKLASS
jgi:hypothetical protein